MKDNIWEFFEQKFYVLLLFGALGLWTPVVLHLVHHDPQSASWGREVFSGLMGAFLGLITGVKIAGQVNGAAPAPPEQK